MNQFFWYATRSTGFVATGLAVGSLVLGLFFSARNTGAKRPANWWLDLHNYLGGLALVFTGAHILASILDPSSGIGIIQAIVPGTADTAAWAMTWGVLAAYTFCIAVFTSWPKRRFSRRVWRWLHLSSVVGVALGGIHAYQLGTDATAITFEIVLLVCAAFGTYAVALRAISAIHRATSH